MIVKFTFGLPGSGKSTWINQQTFFGAEEKYHIISADNIKEKLIKKLSVLSNSNELKDLHEKSVKIADDEFKSLINEGVEIIVDGGGINNSYTINQIDYAFNNGYHIELVVFDTPASVCIQRNKGRDRSFVVPEEAIIRKSVRFNRCLNKLIPLVHDVTYIHYYNDKIFFVDMDGTIAAYQDIPKDELGGIDFVDGQYFSLAKPVGPVIDRLKKLSSKGKTINVLSAAPDSLCIEDKRSWISKNTPFVNQSYFIGNKKYKLNMLQNIMRRDKLDIRDVTVIDDDHIRLEEYNKAGVKAIHPSMFLACSII